MSDPSGLTPTTAAIVAFLRDIGLSVVFETVAQNTVLPSMTVRDGQLIVDPARVDYPGDLLHEAGHIAVTDPALRPTLCDVSSDPAEEMAAIAWSYAAALAAKIDPALVFHDDGYARAQGGYVGGDFLVRAFESGATMGQPMLHAWGMCTDANIAKDATGPVFPDMTRWLR